MGVRFADNKGVERTQGFLAQTHARAAASLLEVTSMAHQTKHESHHSEGSTDYTTSHAEIRKWVESRGGKPTSVKGTGSKNDVGLLRIDFPGYSGEGKLEPIPWDDFFEKFDEQGLAFLYQEKTKDGEKSNFCKLVSRDTARERSHGRDSK
jgi:hypothetical protein